MKINIEVEQDNDSLANSIKEQNSIIIKFLSEMRKKKLISVNNNKNIDSLTEAIKSGSFNRSRWIPSAS